MWGDLSSLLGLGAGIVRSTEVNVSHTFCLQRVAVTTAANMCRQLPSDAADFVTEAVPLLTNLLQYQDSKVRLCEIRVSSFCA